MNNIEKAAIDWLNCERENYSKDGVYYHFYEYSNIST